MLRGFLSCLQHFHRAAGGLQGLAVQFIAVQLGQLLRIFRKMYYNEGERGVQA